MHTATILLKESYQIKDNTEKNVSMKYDDYKLTIEEILEPRNKEVSIECSRCYEAMFKKK